MHTPVLCYYISGQISDKINDKTTLLLNVRPSIQSIPCLRWSSLHNLYCHSVCFEILIMHPGFMRLLESEKILIGRLIFLSFTFYYWGESEIASIVINVAWREKYSDLFWMYLLDRRILLKILLLETFIFSCCVVHIVWSLSLLVGC